MIKMRNVAGVSLLAAGALALAGCGGSTDSGSGVVTFAMTDAPVTDATSVVIKMTEFELKPAEGPSVVFELGEEEGTLDLLTLTNGDSAVILEGVEVPAGEYEWVRIFFDQDASYVEVAGDPGGQYSFFMPSGAQTGYKVVGGFTVPVNDSAEFILDFDLQKSLIEPPGLRGRFGEERGFLLKPTIRLMPMDETGGVTGTVAPELLAANSDPEVCEGGDAVYAFEGSEVDVNDSANVPLVTDIVDFDMDANVYEYHFMYLLPGDYTLAFTCSADSDGGDGEDYVFTPGNLGFSDPVTVTIADGEIAECNLGVDDWDCAPETDE